MCIKLHPYNFDYYVYLVKICKAILLKDYFKKNSSKAKDYESGEEFKKGLMSYAIELGIGEDNAGYKSIMADCEETLMAAKYTGLTKKYVNLPKSTAKDCVQSIRTLRSYAKNVNLPNEDSKVKQYVKELNTLIEKLKISEAEAYYNELDRSGLEETKQSYDNFLNYLEENGVYNFPNKNNLLTSLQQDIKKHKMNELQKKLDALPIKTEDEAIHTLDQLKQYCKTLDLPVDNEIIEKVNQTIAQFDLEARSVYGVEFSGRDEAIIAKKEYGALEQLRKHCEDNSKVTLESFKGALDKLSLKSNLKEQYINYFQLKKQLQSIKDELNNYITPRQIDDVLNNVQNKYPVSMNNLLELLKKESELIEVRKETLHNSPEKADYIKAYHYQEFGPGGYFDLWEDVGLPIIGFFAIKFLLGFIIGSWSTVIAVIFVVVRIGMTVIRVVSSIAENAKLKGVHEKLCKKYGVDKLEPFE